MSNRIQASLRQEVGKSSGIFLRNAKEYVLRFQNTLKSYRKGGSMANRRRSFLWSLRLLFTV